MTDPLQNDGDEALLTAYALGELDAAERVAFEAAWGTSLERRAALAEACAEISRAAQMLSTALGQEPTPALERPIDLNAAPTVPAVAPQFVADAPTALSRDTSRETTSPLFTRPTNYSAKGTYMSVTKIAIAAGLLLAVGAGVFLTTSMSDKMFVQVSSELAPAKAMAPQTAARRTDMKSAPGQGAPSVYYLQDDVSYDTRPRGELERAEETRTPERDVSRPEPTTKSPAPRQPERQPEPGRPVFSPPVSTTPAGPPPHIAPNDQGPSQWINEGGLPRQDPSRERFTQIVENDFLRVGQHPLSTFSIDVDTASYSNMRRYLNAHQRPRPDSVRIEEFLNYFSYDYAPPKDSTPFAAHIEAAACPWKENHRLVRIGLKGKEIAKDQRPVSNLVFLIDVSGSMNQPDKLPFVKEGLKMLVDQLGENDRVAITVYAGAAGLVLPSTMGDKKSDIIRALDALQAGGSTAGGAGIQLAYSVALDNFIKGGTNRVILCSDGDFNVGISSIPELQKLIEDKAKSGVFLSVLGFGGGNTRDDVMETLADKGNGNYAHVDNLNEAKKVFVEQMTGTLITIAKDVKIQVEFNPAQVAAYRLIGYENRALAARDFNDDKKDAGEIGAGHTVTAIYEVVPAGVDVPSGTTDKLRYQKTPEKTETATNSDEMLTLKLRYKQPEGDTSTLLEFPLKDDGQKFGQASVDFKWAAAVASFGMLLRNSPYAGNSTYAAVIEMAESAKGSDKQGYRAEFIELVKRARQLGQ